MQPYAVAREIEDIEALLDDAGGSGYLYGVSSGGALALQAAAKLGSAKVTKLAIYDHPTVRNRRISPGRSNASMSWSGRRNVVKPRRFSCPQSVPRPKPWKP